METRSLSKAILDTSDPDLLAAAAEECKMLIEIKHPNIVRILDIVRKRDVPYIVMERLQGATWEEIYEKNRGPVLSY